MERILSKYSAYTNHIASLSVDPSVKPADRTKLKGYYQKWIDDFKYLLVVGFCRPPGAFYYSFKGYAVW